MATSMIGTNATKRMLPLLITLGVVLFSGVDATAQSAVPLPSWTDGEVKKAIVQFVVSVTTKGGPDYVPPKQRIATFDNDGTLWSERPWVQGMFMVYQLEKMAKRDLSLRDKQPFKAAFEHDREYFKREGVAVILEPFIAILVGMSQEDLEAEIEEFFAKAKHPSLNVPYRQSVYQPMIELLEYLRANGFKTYICSAGGIDFIRVISSELYGIEPDQVIGSSMKKELQQIEGKWVLVLTSELNALNDKEEKAVNIDLHIGQRPLLAIGNVRSGGDIGMLSYSQGRRGPSLQILVNHDDEKREFAYAEEDNASLNEAKANGWLVVSIKNDWSSVFLLGER